jgi:hypothetical protein
VTEVILQPAVGQVIGTRSLRLHAAVHLMVALHRGWRAVRAVVVSVGLDGHGARRQREVEPDSRKQPKGSPPRGLSLRAVSQMAQLPVSNRISAYRLVILPAQVKDQYHAIQNMNWIENWLEPTDDSQSLLSSQT